MVEYNIRTCYKYHKCMYCNCYSNIKMCNCDKTVKPIKANHTENVLYAFTRIFDDKINPYKKTFIQTKNTLYSYGSNLEKKFTFSLCPACNSQFQRLSKKTTKSITFENSNNSNFCDKRSVIDPILLHTEEFINSQSSDDYEKYEKTQVSFTLTVKKADGKLLPGKWLTLDAFSFKKFAIQVQKYIQITMGVDDID